MLSKSLTYLRSAIAMLILLTVLTGVLYPLLITGIGQLFFNYQANGSLITEHKEIVGSTLIGQQFQAARYFSGRPSATTPIPYNAEASNSSNYGASNPAYINVVASRISAQKQANPDADMSVPIDLISASASGIDPDISPAAAYYQAPRIAKIRQLPIGVINNLIKYQIRPRQWGVLGEPRVNVLEINLALDQLK